VTDRLHAHILSVLLDLPHVVLDNNYGKVSGFMSCWTAGFPGVSTATSLPEALAWAETRAAAHAHARHAA
jgi:pyruvyl transferase EpsO